MYDVILQPITSESKIPFDKYLLLYDGTLAVTGKLHSITRDGFIFRRIGEVDIFAIFGRSELTYNPTHYAILNITIEK